MTSFGTASVDVELDAKRAVAQLRGLLSTIASSDARVTLSVSVSNIPGQIESAIDAADSHIEITGDAREVTGSITSAVEDADTEVTATAEAGDVTREIDASVDAADTEVAVEGDASGVTEAIDGAVKGAKPPKIPIEGDPDPLKESIKDGLGEGPKEAPSKGSQTGGAFASGFSRAVQNALHSLPEIELGANSTDAQREIASIRDQLLKLQDESIGVTLSDEEAVLEIGRLQERLQQLDSDDVALGVRVDSQAATSSLDEFTDSLDASDEAVLAVAASGSKLTGVLQALAGVGVAAGLFKAVTAASDLSESISKANVVFGEGIDQVREFGETSATSVGLSEQAALEATATFGNLFVSLGTTKQQATDLAPAVVQLAADFASFNNLPLEETLEKLRSGLVGEIEPLRSLGVSFTAVDVQNKAMELGLADTNGTISEGAKLQARWALILEQSGTAQGDFARTSAGLANQQRIVSAEFQNAITQLGEALLPALLEGVAVTREQLIPAFVDFGESVLPALADILVSTLPAVGGFTHLLVALAPALQTVAGAVGSIPPELLTLIGLLVTFRKIGNSSLVQGLQAGFKNLADPEKGPGGFSKSLRGSISDMIAANAVSVGLSLGLATIGLAMEEDAAKAAEFRRQVEQIKSSLDTALSESTNTVDAFTKVFEDLVEQGGNGANVLAHFGLTAEEFATAVTKGGATAESFRKQLGLTTDDLGILNEFLEQFSDQVQQAAEQQVQAIRSQGDLSESFVDTAIAAQTQEEAVLGVTATQTDWVAVLGTLTEEQKNAAEAIGVTTDETGALVQATGPAADAASVLALSLAQVKDSSGNISAELTGLAQAAGNARIAEEDLQNVADTLGVSMDDLQTFIQSVNDAINSFADDTLATIPSVGDLIGDLGDEFSPEALLDKLQDATEGIANFQTNIEALAAFPRVQQIAATNGPFVAAALAKPIEDGNTEILQQLEDQAGAFDLHYAALDDDLRNKLGPQIADATGLTGSLATDAFGANFNPQEQATIATHGAEIAIANANAGMTTAGEDLGKSGTAGFSTGVGGMPVASTQAADSSIEAINARNFAANLAGALFGRGIADPFSDSVGKMPVATSDSGKKSISAVNAQGPFAKLAGTIFGNSFSVGTASGSKGMSAAAGGAADSAISKVSSKAKAASGAGFSVGLALGSGMQSGINSAAAAVGQAAADMVSGAIAKAKAKAQIGSPSKVFASMGEDMGEGMAIGLTRTVGPVVEASTGLVVSAAAAAAAKEVEFAKRQSVRPLTVSNEAQTAISAAVAAQSGTNITFASGAFQISFEQAPSRAEADAVGDQIADSIATTLQRRLVRVAARTAR